MRTKPGIEFIIWRLYLLFGSRHWMERPRYRVAVVFHWISLVFSQCVCYSLHLEPLLWVYPIPKIVLSTYEQTSSAYKQFHWHRWFGRLFFVLNNCRTLLWTSISLTTLTLKQLTTGVLEGQNQFLARRYSFFFFHNFLRCIFILVPMAIFVWLFVGPRCRKKKWDRVRSKLFFIFIKIQKQFKKKRKEPS